MISFLTSGLDTPHGFFTRIGGVSEGSYASLNCGQFGTDSSANITENRARAIKALGLAVPLIGLRQVHGTTVITATAAHIGQPPNEADALVTRESGLALGIITADCAPVLFSTPSGIIGAAHAGWRGAVAGILEATVTAMRELGANDIGAAIGPCIHQESYEVGADLRDAVLGQASENERFFMRTAPDRWLFDLPSYCSARLSKIGVEVQTIVANTFTDESLFFSHRRRTQRNEGPGGHQISIIRIAS